MSEFITGADRERAQALLREGEALLWVGKPMPTGLNGVSRPYIFAAAAFVVFSCVLFCIFGQELPPVGPVMLGIFLLPELVLCIALPLVKYRQMCRWLYVLTDRRAIALRHDDAQEWPLAPCMVRNYKPGAHGSIVFSYRKSIFHSNRPWLLEEGFLRCREADAVMEQLGRLLSGHARPPMASPDAQKRMAQIFNESQAKRLAASSVLPVWFTLLLLLGLGGLGTAPWWWRHLDFPLNAFMLFMALCLTLITSANLRTYFQGKKLLEKS